MTYFTENMGNFVAQFNRIRILQIQFFITAQLVVWEDGSLQNISFLVLNTR